MNFELGHGKVHGLSHQRNQIIKWLEIADFEPNFFFFVVHPCLVLQNSPIYFQFFQCHFSNIQRLHEKGFLL